QTPGAAVFTRLRGCRAFGESGGHRPPGPPPHPPSHRCHPSPGRNSGFKATPTCPTCADAFLARPAPSLLFRNFQPCVHDRPHARTNHRVRCRTAGDLLARPDTARRQLPGLTPMLSGQPVLSPALIIVCVIMVITAGLIYWVTALGSPWTVPWAAIRAAVQLAAVAGVLAAEIGRAHV